MSISARVATIMAACPMSADYIGDFQSNSNHVSDNDKSGNQQQEGQKGQPGQILLDKALDRRPEPVEQGGNQEEPRAA